MSIFFLEGLPGAGKSYEAISRHLLPALQSGRAVLTNIPGLDQDKIKAFLGLTSITLCYVNIDEAVQSAVDALQNSGRAVPAAALNSCAAKSAQDSISAHVKPDSLLILDEVQNYWGDAYADLPVESVRLISEHRHHGLDIVLLGQDYRDVHQLIRRRIEVLTRLNKMAALGSPTRYGWINYSLGGGKLAKMRSGFQKYDKAIFDLYQSHAASTKNKTLYADDRNSLFKGFFFKYFMPIVFAIGCLAVWFVYSLFWGANTLDKKLIPVASPSGFHSPSSVVPSMLPSAVPPSFHLPSSGVSSMPSSAVRSIPSSAVAPAPPVTVLTKTFKVLEPKNEAAQFYDLAFQTFRARFSAFVMSADKKRLSGYLDLVDDDTIKERFKLADLAAAGFLITVESPGIRLKSPTGKIWLASAWPADAKTTGDDGHKTRESVGDARR